MPLMAVSAAVEVAYVTSQAARLVGGAFADDRRVNQLAELREGGPEIGARGLRAQAPHEHFHRPEVFATGLRRHTNDDVFELDLGEGRRRRRHLCQVGIDTASAKLAVMPKTVFLLPLAEVSAGLPIAFPA